MMVRTLKLLVATAFVALAIKPYGYDTSNCVWIRGAHGDDDGDASLFDDDDFPAIEIDLGDE